ncbi:hypothetical protein LB518_22890 [Mesorhizobium sp. BR1-1-16]|uniref:hypothetical protein n=1 Tax=Mesorhizobium sp. BR1-1-16 TaxID=2876653 RepID=UPI001CCF48AE|nr:hypothetical protein [Mesorhizobium sp. BR1-1-16]MBZ9939162.1 hypothetical protein [Mesorhizobium sp. BR1-1-16]
MNIAAETPKEHNLPVPPPEAMITVLLSEMRRSQDEAASTNGSMRSTYAKAEAKGVNLAAAKRALKIQKSGKAEEFVDEMTKLLQYLNILGIGVQKSQLDLFEVAPTLAPIDEKAELDGLRAGRFGEPADHNPHDLSTDAGQRWLEGHYRGTEERKLVFALQAAEESETEVIEGDEADDGQTDVEDEEPFGGPWPDDAQVAAHAAE